MCFVIIKAVKFSPFVIFLQCLSFYVVNVPTGYLGIITKKGCESTQRGISRIYLFGGKIGRILLIFKHSSSGILKKTQNICFNYGLVFSDLRNLRFCKISEESLPFVSIAGERGLLKPLKSYT